jgi:ribosomal protein S17E
MIQDVSGSLMNEFADRIQADLSRGKNGAASMAAPVRKKKKNQVSGFKLGWIAFKSGIARFFKKLFGKDGS